MENGPKVLEGATPTPPSTDATAPTSIARNSPGTWPCLVAIASPTCPYVEVGPYRASLSRGVPGAGGDFFATAEVLGVL